MKAANWLPGKQAVDPVLMNSMEATGMKHRQVLNPKHGSRPQQVAYRSIEAIGMGSPTMSGE